MDWTRILLATLSGAVAGLIASIVAKPKERPALYPLVMAIAFVAVNALSDAFLLPVVHSWQARAQARAAMSKEWNTYSIDDSALSLSLPGPLTPERVEIPENIKQATSNFSMYRYDADGTQIAVSHVVYNPGIVANLDGAVGGAMANMARQAGVADVEHSKKMVDLHGHPAAVVDFHLRGNGDAIDGRGLFLTDANQAWTALILYKPDQAAGPVFASRVIESAALKTAN